SRPIRSLRSTGAGRPCPLIEVGVHAQQLAQVDDRKEHGDAMTVSRIACPIPATAIDASASGPVAPPRSGR
ncbi:MAG: hypothetical protein O6758_02715, partial [Planctomycetota bacterium]|nr:hypothetical protein [Planctomycetota bacterium]